MKLLPVTLLWIGVSIPNGTIKSKKGGGLWTSLSVVSIPNGTIKRRGNLEETGIDTVVSIPNGTIKRPGLKLTKRLYISFNSKWYD